ncbi:MAG: ABC transporter ATP-binding protein [Candidatus Shapirobacteria bacterium]
MFPLLRTYFRFLGRYPGWLAVFWAALIGFAITEGFEPYFYKLLIDSIGVKSEREIVMIVSGLGLFRLGGLLLSNLFRAAGDRVVLPASRDLRVAVIEKIHELDFAFHTSRSTGSLISIIKRGDGAFFDFFQNININTVRIVIEFSIMSVVLYQVNPMIMAMMMTAFGGALILTKRLVSLNLTARKEFNEAEDKISEIIVDNLINYETVKLFARESWERKRLSKSFINWLSKLWSYALSYRIIDIVVGGLGNLGVVGALVVGLSLVNKGEISTGDYVMVIGFVTNFYGRFFELIYNLRSVAKNMVDIQKYFGVLDEKILVSDPKKPIAITGRVAGEIEFKGISFNYPENNKSAVSEIDLKIGAGQSVALVGSSGVGKTTLVKLLLRFFDPTSGAITIDGVDIRKIKKSLLRAMMGVVPQEPIMFNNTIGYNIAYGLPNATAREIVAAARMANLADFIETLPKKYETSVGERGVKLSGGQKQRLAIARMILKNPDIIVFDEATSQLDSATEKLIQDAFWQAAKNKTAIVIAHRLSTIIRAEKIVVMEKGRIVEVGTHRQLISNKGGLYTNFWKLQSLATAK